MAFFKNLLHQQEYFFPPFSYRLANSFTYISHGFWIKHSVQELHDFIWYKKLKWINRHFLMMQTSVVPFFLFFKKSFSCVLYCQTQRLLFDDVPWTMDLQPSLKGKHDPAGLDSSIKTWQESIPASLQRTFPRGIVNVHFSFSTSTLSLSGNPSWWCDKRGTSSQPSANCLLWPTDGQVTKGALLY